MSFWVSGFPLDSWFDFFWTHAGWWDESWSFHLIAFQGHVWGSTAGTIWYLPLGTAGLLTKADIWDSEIVLRGSWVMEDWELRSGSMTMPKTYIGGGGFRLTMGTGDWVDGWHVSCTLKLSNFCSKWEIFLWLKYAFRFRFLEPKYA